jgi:hypothetical protein
MNLGSALDRELKTPSGIEPVWLMFRLARIRFRLRRAGLDRGRGGSHDAPRALAVAMQRNLIILGVALVGIGLAWPWISIFRR